jgi:hypothetical protein
MARVFATGFLGKNTQAGSPPIIVGIEDGVLQREVRTMGTHLEVRGNHSHSSPFSSSRV